VWSRGEGESPNRPAVDLFRNL